jgi:YD repeat-containing protein
MRKTGKRLRDSATTEAATQARSATQYDNSDRLTQVVDSAAGTITRTYDNFDNLIDEQTPQGEVTYSYDAARRLQTRTVVGETAVSYAWDNAGNPLSAVQGSATLSYAYDSAGRVSSVTMPNGVVVANTYDGDSRIAAIAYSNGSGSLGNLTYTYDANGRVVSKGGSLASIVMPASVSGNAFNAANEMTGFNSEPLTYDPNGNLLNDGTNTYAWDSRNQLASLAGPTSASFTYDALGRRVGETIADAATGYLYDLANAVMPLQEFSSTGTPLLSGLGTSRVDLSGIMTFLPDAQNNTIALTDDSGAMQTDYSYGPLGAVAITGAASDNPYQFGGMQNDGTGVYYGSAGYYSPTSGLVIAGGTVSSDTAGVGGFTSLSAPSSANATSPGSSSCDKCEATLYAKPLGSGSWGPNLHSYWKVKLDGMTTFVSGEPTNSWDSKKGFGSLIVELNYPTDVNANGTIANTWGPCSEICPNVIGLLGAAQAWDQQPAVAYVLRGGPNSNSTARYLSVVGGEFGMTPASAPVPFPPSGLISAVGGWFKWIPDRNPPDTQSH